jgi:lipopolysaccharide export system permease protein
MRILDRLVLGTFLKLFAIFLVASPVLFIVGDITEELDTFVDRGLTMAEVARAYLFQLPLYVQWSFPVAALLAAVFTVHGMTTHREIVAAKAGGVSFHRLVRPVLILGVLLTGVALALTEIVPRSNRIAAQILRNEEVGRTWRSDFVYQSEDGTTWQVGRLDAGQGSMSQVVLERPPTGEEPAVHVTADAAAFDSIDGWTFARGWVRHIFADSTEHAYQFERMVMAGLDERPDELLDRPREPDEMTYAEIERLAGMVRRSGGDARELLVEQEQKLSLPVATLVVILLGAPLATSNKRGGTAYGIGVSLAITMLYILLFKISGGLGEAGVMEPALAAWIPNVLFFGAALVLLARVRT